MSERTCNVLAYTSTVSAERGACGRPGRRQDMNKVVLHWTFEEPPRGRSMLRRLLCAPCALVGVSIAMHGYCVCNVLCCHGITQSSPHAFLWIASKAGVYKYLAVLKLAK